MQSSGRWFLARILPYRTDEDRIDGVVVTFIEITARKQADIKTQALVQETAILQERNRMARDLHDSLAQSFTAIKLQIDAAEDGLREGAADVEAHLERAREVAQDGLQEARRAVRSLRSAALETGNMPSALRRLVEPVIPIPETAALLTVTGRPFALPATVEGELYRMAQEAFTNALRHSQAAQIDVVLSYNPAEIQLRIEDNGTGFNQQDPNAGLGLVGMRERANRIGAELSVNSNLGQGTKVRVTLPKASLSLQPGSPER